MYSTRDVVNNIVIILYGAKFTEIMNHYVVHLKLI